MGTDYSMKDKNIMIETEDKLSVSQEKIIELRRATGMNRKEFCEYFQIPYRTVTEWERGNRTMPDYVLRLLTYYVRTKILGEKNVELETREELLTQSGSKLRLS